MHGIDPLLILAGFTIGSLIGISGVGSGSLMAPFLITIVGVHPVQAIGTDFVYAAATKVTGGYRHWRQGTVDRGVTLRLASASVPGLVTGSIILHRFFHSADANKVITRVLGAALIVVAVSLIPRIIRPQEQLSLGSRRVLPWSVLYPIAFAFGVLVGVTSVGSGSLFVLLLTSAIMLPLPCVVGTDIAHAALLTGAGALVNLGARTVNPGITVNLLAGSLPGVWLASSLTVRLPRRALTGTLVVILGFVGERYLFP